MQASRSQTWTSDSSRSYVSLEMGILYQAVKQKSHQTEDLHDTSEI